MSERKKPSNKSGIARGEARLRLLDAALQVIREKGYAASSVDDICQAAGVTKGAFFHHFAAKEDLAVAAADHFAAMAEGIFATAPYRALPRAKDRVIGYVRFRQAIMDRALAEFTCLLGTMVQEAYDTHPVIRTACDRHMSDHAAMVQRDIDAAMAEEGLSPDWTAESLAFYIQAVMQGSFIFAKAKQGPAIAKANLDHLITYLEIALSQKP
ncbi:TetR/AcrR family transcriptional regulator [Dongia rigui]|uniref:Helix-turn-helix domain-containing protein n=1 Tax=Dongia rigui TaxID=940149 RepID=A0ABU5DW24_9PROT|nr:helix-turn-helix domain-containing protein [Dongia rigui]MDY0871497.1 helix-turn-helix domain-containing protein [Dongia rigui]